MASSGDGGYDDDDFDDDDDEGEDNEGDDNNGYGNDRNGNIKRDAGLSASAKQPETERGWVCVCGFSMTRTITHVFSVANREKQ